MDQRVLGNGMGDVRVEDYLNDKLQDETDFQNIESLLRNVLDQKILLKKQLFDAEAVLDKTKRESESHEQKIRQQAEDFQRQQAEIDRRLLIVTQSESSDNAVRRFRSSIEKLRRLEIARDYIELLKEIDNLRNTARENVGSSPQVALQPYIRLQAISATLKEAQPAAEGAAPNLIYHVDQEARSLWLELKKSFGGDFERVLKKMKWPTKNLVFTPLIEQEWREGVERLLDLQEPEFQAKGDRIGSKLKSEDPFVLLPLEIMVQSLELGFKYHFESNRPTNRSDKPEYFLSHVLNLLNRHADFFIEHLQPILSARLQKSKVDLDWIYTDSTSAFITSLLPMLRHKLFELVPRIAGQPQLLSHCIHELMNFDTTLRDDWEYDGGYYLQGWKGLTWEILVKRDFFGRWLQVEKDFALARYQEIIDSKDNGEIDYDTLDPGMTKPTKAAIRVNDLLETITDRYRPLFSFTHKLRFLIDIQIAIFDKFHQRLKSSLEAYLTLTSTIGRTVQGSSAEDRAKTQGMAGLERLCRIFGSSEYLEKKMRDWSDDIFFLELWDELQERARGHSVTKSLVGEMTVSDIAERTSSSVGSAGDSGALFDETAGAYHDLRVRSESVIQETVTHSVRDSLRPYSRINPWSSLSTAPDMSSSNVPSASNLLVTAELDPTIQLLSTYLSFLSRALGAAPLRRIMQNVCSAIQSYLWDYVLIRTNFSTAGIKQFQRDTQAFCNVIDKYVGEGQGKTRMQQLLEGVKLLNLPIRAGGKEQAKEEEQEEIERMENDGGELGLWEVEKRLFKSNEDAREVLADLGLETMSESEARQVLGRRIELGS
ncbi:MAG: hypothetical protein M1834_008757 [Cirrosporium novae-zelandiae]|nr:MAG: hypothetical protein M1834_008757 [Cirrosporium novae-zelandiae]